MQLCHNYKPPFLSVAAQYASLFDGTPYKVITVYLKGSFSETVIENSKSSEVIFLDLRKNDLRGLKRKAIRAIEDLHARYQFQLAIAHRYKAIYIATHVEQLFVVGVHHTDKVYKRWTRRWYVMSRQRQLVLLGVSKAIREDLRTWLPKYPRDRIVYLYNSLNYDKIRREQLPRGESRLHLSLPQEAFIFGCVGRLHPAKDHKTLIKGFARAAPHMPKAVLAIVGGGPTKEALEQLIAELHLQKRVFLPGMVRDAYRFFKAFDGFVLPSKREGLPLALLEAFAAHNICAASRCNGSSEAIEGVGFSFEVGDDTGLSLILRRIYEMQSVEKSEMIVKMESKVKNNFTEESVRQSFWSLPMMRRFRKNMKSVGTRD
jgi:glycosyltransferase involved in cell wall biosynthesis